MRLGRFRREADGGFELLERAAGIAGQVQRRAEIQARARILRRHLDRDAKVPDGIRPVALAHRLGSADFVGGRVLQQSGDRLQQRIGRRDLDVAALAEVGVGVPAIAQSTVGHRQRIVEARRPAARARAPPPDG